MRIYKVIILIWILGVITIILKHPVFADIYILVLLLFLNTIAVSIEATITNRRINNELALYTNSSLDNYKDLFLIVGTYSAFSFIYLLSIHTTKWLLLAIIMSVNIFFLILQYQLIKGKRKAKIFLTSDKIIINDLFIREFQISSITEILYDGFTEAYTIKFNISKNISLKESEYSSDDLMIFLKKTIEKFRADIYISPNIREELLPLTGGFAASVAGPTNINKVQS